MSLCMSDSLYVQHRQIAQWDFTVTHEILLLVLFVWSDM